MIAPTSFARRSTLHSPLVVAAVALAALFGAAFVATFVAPERAERAVTALLRDRVEAAAHAKIEKLGDSVLRKAALRSFSRTLTRTPCATCSPTCASSPARRRSRSCSSPRARSKAVPPC